MTQNLEVELESHHTTIMSFFQNIRLKQKRTLGGFHQWRRHVMLRVFLRTPWPEKKLYIIIKNFYLFTFKKN